MSTEIERYTFAEDATVCLWYVIDREEFACLATFNTRDGAERYVALLNEGA